MGYTRGVNMTDFELIACAHEAFSAVAKEHEQEMGQPSKSERATICEALVREMRSGLAMPEVSGLPLERQKRVMVHAGQILMRKLVERTFAS
jgi:hypothetical protein